MIYFSYLTLIIALSLFLSIFKCQQVKIAFIIEVGRQDIRTATIYALNVLVGSNGFLNGITIVSNFYEVQNTTSVLGLRNSICNGQAQTPGLPVPDVIINLLSIPKSRSAHFCSIQELSRILDVGFMSNSAIRCPLLSVSESNINDFTNKPALPILKGASVRFSDGIYAKAITNFMRYLVRNASTSMLVFRDGTIGTEYNFMEKNLEYFTPNFIIDLPEVTNPKTDIQTLVQMIHNLRSFTDSEIWVALINLQNSERLINALQSELAVKKFPNCLSVQWIFFDSSINSANCSFLCPNSARCGFPNSPDSFTCMRLAHNQVDDVKIENFKTILGATWSVDPLTNLESIYAYEATITAGQAISSLLTTVNWAVPQTNPMTKICYPDIIPIVTPQSRFYQFTKTVSQLPSRDGIITPIFFDGGFRSKSLKMAFFDCNRTPPNICIDSGASYDALTDIFMPAKISINITSMPLRVILIEDPPFVMLENGSYVGYAVDVFKHIAETLNLTYIFEAPEDPVYGMLQPDGTWTGLIGQITEGRADIGIGSIVITSEQEKVVDFTISFYYEGGLSIVTSKDQSSTVDSWFFMSVFNWSVWVCILASLVLSAVLIVIFDRLSPYSYQNKDVLAPGEPEGMVFTPKEAAWFVIGAYTQLGEMFDPRATSSRFIIGGFWIFTAIMMALFNANLSAFLTVGGLNTGIQNFDDLISQTDIKYTVRNNSASQMFFERMKNIEQVLLDKWSYLALNSMWQYPIKEQYTSVYRRMTDWGFTQSAEDTLNKIKDGWAVFMETPLAEYYTANSCSLTIIGDRISNWPYGFAFATNSPLTKHFNDVILQMQNDQSLETIKSIYWPNTHSCRTIDTNGGFHVEQIAGVFIVLSCGIGLGFIFLIGEILVTRYRKKQKMTIGSPKHTDSNMSIANTSSGNLEAEVQLKEFQKSCRRNHRMSLVLHHPKPALMASRPSVIHQWDKTEF